MSGLFSKDELLQRDIKLADHNFASAVTLFLGLLICTACFSYLESGSTFPLKWLAAAIPIWIVSVAFYLTQREQLRHSPTRHASIAVTIVVINSLVLSVLLLAMIPSASLALVLFLMCVSIVLVFCAAAWAVPFMPIFFGMAAPLFISVIYALIQRSDSMSQWLSLSALLFVVGSTWFARTLSKSIRSMIDTNRERNELATKLRVALNQTDDANRSKSVFLASASHDLRQPLHALGLLVETLGGTPLDKSQTEIHDHMREAIDSTNTMLESLLNISKLDAGAIMAEPKAFFIQGLFSKLETELAPTADESNLIYRSRDTIAAAYSDPFIVELILRNLIANAIRYTRQGGLLVACRSEGSERIRIEVWDTGVGIPETQIEDIFREFKQVDNPERDAKKGFGLGLSIAQGLAKTIDSEIKVRSAVDRGSVFSFSIQRSTADIIEDTRTDVNQEDSFAGARVAVIDDDYRVRTAMHQLLENWGFICVSGETAEEILQQTKTLSRSEQYYDIALVDYRLRENKTGKQAIETLRDNFGNDLPAIIVTGDTGKDKLEEAKSVDALLIHKPASTNQLRTLMRTLIGPS